MNKMVVFAGSSNPKLAEKICKSLEIKMGEAFVSKFSDGEVRVKIKDNVRGKDVFVIL